MVDFVGQLTASARTTRVELDFGAGLRRLDWLLMLAIGALVGYGLWAIAGITRFDVPGDPHHDVVRQAIAAGLGAVAFVVAALVPPSLLQRSLARPLSRHDRDDGLRLRRRARRSAARSAGS